MTPRILARRLPSPGRGPGARWKSTACPLRLTFARRRICDDLASFASPTPPATPPEEPPTVDLETFRRETRAWLEANAPKSLFGQSGSGARGHLGRAQGDLSESRHEALARPRRRPRLHRADLAEGIRGRGGLDPAEAKVLASLLRELKLPRAADRLRPHDDRSDAAALRERRAEEAPLPRICRGEIRWCSGYSEPGAGSDLASLQTKAVRDGDHFILNGTKVWTSYADQADWIFALVRTNPAAKKQEGITFILVDHGHPGRSASHRSC